MSSGLGVNRSQTWCIAHKSGNFAHVHYMQRGKASAVKIRVTIFDHLAADIT